MKQNLKTKLQVSKDNFERAIGRRLRNAEVKVPSNSWEAIRSQLNTPVPVSNFGFGAAIVAATVLLFSLGVYSEVRDAAVDSSTLTAAIKVTEVASNEAPQQEMTEVESHTENGGRDNVRPTEVEPAFAEIPVAKKTQSESGSNGSSKSEIEESQKEPNDPESVNEESTEEVVAASEIAESEIPERVEKESRLNPDDEKGVLDTTVPLSADIAVDKHVGYAPHTVKFEASGNATSHYWDFGSQGKSTTKSAVKTFDRPGTYSVFLTASDADGNVRTDMVTIIVKEGSNLVVPDSFTPNGDGLNDTYKVEGINLESFQITIINGLGHELFRTNNINEAWEFDPSSGRSSGEAYFAIIQARGIDGKIYNLRQPINVIY